MVKINAILDKNISNVVVVRVNQQPIEVKTALTTEQFTSFVVTATELCYDEKGEYNGAYERIALRYAIVKYLTDIDTDELTVNDIFDLTFQSWFEKVLKTIERTSYWAELTDAVKDNIANRKTAFDNLCVSVKAAIDKFSVDTSDETIASLISVAQHLKMADDKKVADGVVKRSRKAAKNNGEKSKVATEQN